MMAVWFLISDKVPWASLYVWDCTVCNFKRKLPPVRQGYDIMRLVFKIRRTLRYFTLQSPMVTVCTTSLTYSTSTFCPHSLFMCFVLIWEQTAIISLFSVCITETECVYCAVRAESLSLCIIQAALWSFKGYSLHSFVIHLVLNVALSIFIVSLLFTLLLVSYSCINLGDIFVDARRVALPCMAAVCVPAPILRRWHKISTLSVFPSIDSLYGKYADCSVGCCILQPWNLQLPKVEQSQELVCCSVKYRKHGVT
jgi:hypothetical protein